MNRSYTSTPELLVRKAGVERKETYSAGETWNNRPATTGYLNESRRTIAQVMIWRKITPNVERKKTYSAGETWNNRPATTVYLNESRRTIAQVMTWRKITPNNAVVLIRKQNRTTWNSPAERWSRHTCWSEKLRRRSSLM